MFNDFFKDFKDYLKNNGIKFLNLLPPFFGGLVGAFIGSKLGNLFNIIIGIFLGIFLGAILCVLIYKDNNLLEDTQEDNLLEDTQEDNCTSPKKQPCLIEKTLKDIEETLDLRTLAAQRLRFNEFWIQTINIYYSCFTACLAVASLRDNSEFLELSSVLFTVIVAILVSYANAQGFGNRSNDLKTNCIDLKASLDHCNLFAEALASTLSPTEDTIPKDRLAELDQIKTDFNKKKGDSEDHSIIDMWKYKKRKCYVVYMIFKSIFIALFFIIPLAYIIYNGKDFIALFYSKQLISQN